MVRLDVRAVATGAALAAVLAVAVASLGSAVTDDGDDLSVAFAVAALVGFVIGGWVAGTRQPSAAMAHGALAALVAFAVVQAVTGAMRLADDEEISAVAVASNAVLAAALGLSGGWLAERRGRPLQPGAPDNGDGSQP